MRDILPGGVEYAFDTSGLKSVIGAAIGCLAPHAKFGLVGVPPAMDDCLSVPLNQMIGAGFSFIGIIEGDSDPDVFIPQMIALYREGNFPFDRLITTYPLSAINRAIGDHAAGQCVKAVLLPETTETAA